MGIDNRLNALVDRFTKAVLALPRTPVGDVNIPAATSQLCLAVQSLTQDLNDDIDQNAVAKLLSDLESSIRELEQLILTIHLTNRQTFVDDTGFYEHYLLSDLPTSQICDIAASDTPALSFSGLVSGPIGVAPFLFLTTSAASETIRRLLTVLTGSKTQIAAMLKVISKLGGKAELLKYIASLLETLNDEQQYALQPPKKGGATEACSVDVFLTDLSVSSGAVGNDFTLDFDINGTKKQVVVPNNTDLGTFLKTPLLLRTFNPGGICGQAKNNVVTVKFTATERDFSSNDVGLEGSKKFSKTCPSSETLTIVSLVTEGRSSTNVTASVQVLKQCGATDQIQAP